MTEQEKFEAWYLKEYGCKPRKNADSRDTALFDCWQAAIASREPMTADKIDDVFSCAIANMRKHSKIATGALTDADRYEFHVVRAIEQFHGIG